MYVSGTNGSRPYLDTTLQYAVQRCKQILYGTFYYIFTLREFVRNIT